MRVAVSSRLPVAAPKLWSLVKRATTFRFVTRGVVHLPLAASDDFEWHSGLEISGRLVLFGFLPAWVHVLRFERVDDGARLFETTERGGILGGWKHCEQVWSCGHAQSVLTDVVEFSAGPATLVMLPLVFAFFCYRHLRLKRLLRARCGAIRGAVTPARDPSRGAMACWPLATRSEALSE